MARVKPLNEIADIKLRTLEDIADASANEVRGQVRDKGVIKESIHQSMQSLNQEKVGHQGRHHILI